MQENFGIALTVLGITALMVCLATDQNKPVRSVPEPKPGVMGTRDPSNFLTTTFRRRRSNTIPRYVHHIPPPSPQSDELRGYRNIGNTCYLASTMQLLGSNPDLLKTLSKNVRLTHKTRDFSYAFKQLPFDRPKRQQDAHEALLALLEGAKGLRYGYETERRCLKCHSVSVKKTKMECFFVNPAETIQAAYRETLKSQKIEMKCCKCLHGFAQESVRSVTAPRFEMTLIRRWKVDMSKDTRECRVDLERVQAVVQHHGSDPMSGHYTALVRRNGDLWETNDQYTRRVSKAEADSYSQFPYIVLWRSGMGPLKTQQYINKLRISSPEMLSTPA